MSKPIACVFVLVSLVSLQACAADGGTDTVSAKIAQRDGPRGDLLRPAPEANHAPTSQPPSAQATTDAPDDVPRTPVDSGRTTSVVVGAGSFSPRMINVHLGDTVEFNWQSGTHSVTSGFRCKADGMFASGMRPYPATYRVTFLRTGIFPFYSEPECETMAGMITVTAVSS
jgi:plastocyanin